MYIYIYAMVIHSMYMYMFVHVECLNDALDVELQAPYSARLSPRVRSCSRNAFTSWLKMSKHRNQPKRLAYC